MKKVLMIVLTLVLLFVIVGCEEIDNATTRETEVVEANLNEMQRQVGQPNIDDFYEKKLAKRIFELRDNSNLITYSYTVNLEGKFVFIGKSIGYGLPYSVQYTNPERLERKHTGGNYYPLPQADPNGLYMPDGLSATWIVLINDDGEQEVTYFESDLIVKPNKLPRRLCAEWSLPADY